MLSKKFFQKFSLKVNQIWYPGAVSVSELLRQRRRADILFVHGVPFEQTKGRFCGWQEYHTCMNDITRPEEEMLAAVNKAVRYQFRRSEKDQLEVQFYTKTDIAQSPELMDTFAKLYERMYQSRVRIPNSMCLRYRSIWRRTPYCSPLCGMREMLVFHSYICDATDARLLHSASCFREESADQSMIGRANKRLHWEDILYFKKRD